jgi:hypothetical protein
VLFQRPGRQVQEVGHHRAGRAREDRGEYLAEDALEIADAAEPTTEGVAKARLMVDTRKWFASKSRPACSAIGCRPR